MNDYDHAKVRGEPGFELLHSLHFFLITKTLVHWYFGSNLKCELKCAEINTGNLSDRRQNQHWPLVNACGMLQDSVQLQAFAVQQPPQGNVSQLTYEPERLIQVQEHGEFPLPLSRSDPDGLCHQTCGDPLQSRYSAPRNHKLDWKKKRTYFHHVLHYR